MTPDKVIGTYNGIWLTACLQAHRDAKKDKVRRQVREVPTTTAAGHGMSGYITLPADMENPWKKE